MACLGTTKDGQPCQRNPEVGEQYCWQHTNGFLKKSTLFIASILGVKRRFLIWLIIFSIGVFLLQTYASNKINYRLDQLEFKPNIEMEVSPYLKQDKFGEYLPLIIYNTGDFTFKDIYFAITSCGMDNLYDQYHLPILPAHSQKEIPFGNKHVIDIFKSLECYPFSRLTNVGYSFDFSMSDIQTGKKVSGVSIGCGWCYFKVLLVAQYSKDGKNESFSKNITGMYRAPVQLIYTISQHQ
ncbi:MAG: hypothetical protein QS98_C0010G0043 [archaeon GW2011_AR3]|nr:MAG: hypothetical protein QS98_C0010G0043 [archaeon GW2011_AR3]MBS3110185.1 hypothetical protein [Candidatus Woesearchaeota archaeon]